MEPSKIRELARLMHEEKLSCLEFESDGERIRLECASTPPPTSSSIVQDARGVQAPLTSAALAGEADQRGNLGMDFNDMNLVSSPLVGIFYAAPAEDQPPYVQVGDKVKQGDILCIVEAMKVMNEIVATGDGEVVDICVRNGDVVEFGQPLFKLI